MSGQKLLFRIESKSFSSWDPVMVHIDGPRYGVVPVEWHSSADDAITYARREKEKDALTNRDAHRRSMFRVADHLGYVHWQDPEPHPDLLPPAEPGRCKFCKSTNRAACVTIVYSLQNEREIVCVCPCPCHDEARQ